MKVFCFLVFLILCLQLSEGIYLQINNQGKQLLQALCGSGNSNSPNSYPFLCTFLGIKPKDEVHVCLSPENSFTCVFPNDVCPETFDLTTGTTKQSTICMPDISNKTTTLPITTPTFTPTKTPGISSPPASAPEISSSTAPGTMTSPAPGTMTSPAPGRMTTPAPAPGTMTTPAPAPGTMTTPAPAPGTMTTPAPAPGTMTTPAPGTMTSPAPGIMTTPAPGTMTTPAPGTMTTPAPGTMTTPAPGTMTTPAPGTMTTPAPGTMTTPGKNRGKRQIISMMNGKCSGMFTCTKNSNTNKYECPSKLPGGQNKCLPARLLNKSS